MENNYENLNKLFDWLKSIGFWGRLFHWKEIKSLLVDAAVDLSKLKADSAHLAKSNLNLTSELKSATFDLESRKERIFELDSDLKEIKGIHQHLIEKLNQANQKVTQFETLEESRTEEHKQTLATLKEIRENIRQDRQNEIELRTNAEIIRRESLKATWLNHEHHVEQVIKALCNKHTIHYVDTVPFNGKPDNTVLIAGEYIVFDSKSPEGEDLSNFPGYIKGQTEKVKKYANAENVKKWIFFVVPANTLEVIKTFVYPLADYEVFVISADALEPVLLNLKKIEDYEFADQLSPEDRENICRVIGRFAHLSKRKIQIDTYFIKQFIELAYKAEADLPEDILEKVKEFEKAEKLNPPQEKRAKEISLNELERNNELVRNDMITKGMLLNDELITTDLNNIPLYKSVND